MPTCKGLGHKSSLISSAISSELGSPWSANQVKNVLWISGLFLPFRAAFAFALSTKSVPSFQRIVVLCDAGSPANKQEFLLFFRRIEWNFNKKGWSRLSPLFFYIFPTYFTSISLIFTYFYQLFVLFIIFWNETSFQK